MTLLTLGFSLVQIIVSIINVIQSFYNLDNPLIPSYLSKHIAFPYYFIIPIFIIISWYSYQSLKQKTYNKIVILSLLILTILYLRFGAYLLIFIRSFNPYNI